MSNIEIDNGAERSDSADSIITTEEVSNESTIALPIGTELSGQDIYQIAASEKTQMFVIIGATGSGKTTLVTSIYHCCYQGVILLTSYLRDLIHSLLLKTRI